MDSVLTIPQLITTTLDDLNLTAALGAITRTNLAGIGDVLPDVTVFAPDNAAFQAIASEIANMSIAQLTNVLEFHVLNGTVLYSTMLQNNSIPTSEGVNLQFTTTNGSIFVNNARIVIPDVLVANGVMHVIDELLNPMNATATHNPSKSTGVPAFSGAHSESMVPFTSGVPKPTHPVASKTGGATAQVQSTSTSGIAVPMRTGAVQAAALFGGAAMYINL